MIKVSTYKRTECLNATACDTHERYGYLRDFRLPSRCKWDLCSSGILRSVKW